MCGIFGIADHKEASGLTYLGLYSLQHRGQESCGIVSSNGRKFFKRLGLGLVNDVFKKRELIKLKGRSSIGHVRYSTLGAANMINAQPLTIKYAYGNLSMAHNGNLMNASVLRRKLERSGAIFQTTSDSEVILHLIAHSKASTIEQKIREALSYVTGAYSILFMTDNKVIAVRDPLGVRPLALGLLNGSYVFSSESCAFDLIGAKYVKEVEPGEMLSVSRGKISAFALNKTAQKACCIFEYVYFSRPDSKIFGRSVYGIRKKFGRMLARESVKKNGLGKKKASLVIPVPDSSNVSAVGYFEESGIPYEIGFIRNHYIGRTFIEPNQKIRDFGVKIKFNPVDEAVRSKSVIVVDDSIVRGTTGKKLVRMLKKAGARTVHYRIGSPPVKYPCHYGIDTPERKRLIASDMNLKQIRDYIGADTLHYLSLSGMLSSTGMPPKDFCTACFTGRYPQENPATWEK